VEEELAMHYERCPKCGGPIRGDKCTATGWEQWSYFCPKCHWYEEVDGDIALWKVLQSMNEDQGTPPAAGGKGILQVIRASEDPAQVKDAQARLEAAGIEVVLSEEERTRDILDICWEAGHVRRETENYTVYLLRVPEAQAQTAQQVLHTDRCSKEPDPGKGPP
jgi:hypothetical protein